MCCIGMDVLKHYLHILQVHPIEHMYIDSSLRFMHVSTFMFIKTRRKKDIDVDPTNRYYKVGTQACI